jgi:hemerythrin superfamily protein
MNSPELNASVLAHDHSEIDSLTDDLLAALEEGDKLKVFPRLDLLWARLAVHIRAEHLCLFPSILEADFTIRSDGPQYQEVQSAIDQLRLDHEFFMRELGATIKIMPQENASDHFREVHRSIVVIQSRLTEHNRLEENHVYRWVNVLLGEAERLALETRVKRELENIPPRFSSDVARLD